MSPMAKPKPRPAIPRRMRITDRDKHVLQTIYDFEGLMSKRQIAEVCFDGSVEWAKKRMRVLFENGYVRQPDEDDMHRVPRGEWLYWLDRLGLETIAGLRGEEPLYTDKVRTEAPQWAKVEHDLALNDVRLVILAALARLPSLTLTDWINEKTLNHWADEVTWKQPNGRPAKKRFAMDAFFTISRPRDARNEVFAYLLEIDKGTHSNPAFADEKVRPGIAYITSPAYEQRFGIKYGRYLVVTEGGTRLENMLRQTSRIEGGNRLFYFTTFRELTPDTVFTAPIWRVPGEASPFALIRD